MKKTKQANIVVIGPPNSGKTVFFTVLGSKYRNYKTIEGTQLEWCIIPKDDETFEYVDIRYGRLRNQSWLGISPVRLFPLRFSIREKVGNIINREISVIQSFDIWGEVYENLVKLDKNDLKLLMSSKLEGTALPAKLAGLSEELLGILRKLVVEVYSSDAVILLMTAEIAADESKLNETVKFYNLLHELLVTYPSEVAPEDAKDLNLSTKPLCIMITQSDLISELEPRGYSESLQDDNVGYLGDDHSDDDNIGFINFDDSSLFIPISLFRGDVITLIQQKIEPTIATLRDIFSKDDFTVRAISAIGRTKPCPDCASNSKSVESASELSKGSHVKKKNQEKVQTSVRQCPRCFDRKRVPDGVNPDGVVTPIYWSIEKVLLPDKFQEFEDAIKQLDTSSSSKVLHDKIIKLIDLANGLRREISQEVLPDEFAKFEKLMGDIKKKLTAISGIPNELIARNDHGAVFVIMDTIRSVLELQHRIEIFEKDASGNSSADLSRIQDLLERIDAVKKRVTKDEGKILEKKFMDVLGRKILDLPPEDSIQFIDSICKNKDLV